MLNNFIQITTYALADSVNPCAIAVMTMVLFNAITNKPDKNKNVLAVGLAFISSVYIGYLFYSLILYQLFHSVAEFFSIHSETFKLVMGVFGVIIGLLNIKDFLHYKKGNVGTEMPLFLRPKVKRIIDNISSVKGSFLIGFIVTLFLLPCTSGPLLLAAGTLSNLSIISAIPWMLYYNLVFVLPMIIIVLIVYIGFAKVDQVSGWKENNIKLLHLISGILLLAIGLLLIFGWL